MATDDREKKKAVRELLLLVVVVDVVMDVVVVMVVVEGVTPFMCIMRTGSAPIMITGISVRGTRCC